MSLFRRQPKAQTMTVTMYDGSSWLEVKGESSLQQVLETIAGGRTEDGQNLPVNCVLIRERDNEYDPNAIKVFATDPLTNQAMMVGYINRSDAARLAPGIDQKNAAGEQVGMVGQVRGGWDRGDGDTGHFGIWLLYDPADFGME